MAVPVLRSGHQEAKASGNVTSLVITAPTTIVDDDILIIVLATDGNSTAHNILEAGWAVLGGVNGVKGTSNRCTCQIFWKRASSESGNYTIQWTASEQAYAWIGAFSGVATATDPIQNATNGGTASSNLATIDPVTTAKADTLVICGFACDDDDITVDGGFDADYTGITSDKSNTGNNNCSGAVQTRGEASVADPPVCDWTLTANEEFAAIAIEITATSGNAFERTASQTITESDVVDRGASTFQRTGTTVLVHSEAIDRGGSTFERTGTTVFVHSSVINAVLGKARTAVQTLTHSSVVDRGGGTFARVATTVLVHSETIARVLGNVRTAVQSLTHSSVITRIQAHIRTVILGLASFFDDITTDAGWTIVNGGGQIDIDLSDSNKIEFDALVGGGGTQKRFAHKNLGITLNGDTSDLELRCKWNYLSRTSGFEAGAGIFYASAVAEHIQDSPQIAIFGVRLEQASPEGIIAEYSDNTTRIQTARITSGPASGDRFITVTKIGNTLTLNVYSDAARTMHISGSPVSVDVSSVSGIDMIFATVAHNAFGSGSARGVNAELDDLLVEAPSKAIIISSTVTRLLNSIRTAIQFLIHSESVETVLTTTPVPTPEFGSVRTPRRRITALLSDGFNDVRIIVKVPEITRENVVRILNTIYYPYGEGVPVRIIRQIRKTFENKIRIISPLQKSSSSNVAINLRPISTEGANKAQINVPIFNYGSRDILIKKKVFDKGIKNVTIIRAISIEGSNMVKVKSLPEIIDELENEG